MPGRCTPVISLIYLLAVWLVLGAPGALYAHRLDAQVFVLPDGKIQVESWFSSGEPARGAEVQLFSTAGQLRASAKLDENGVGQFAPGQPESLRIVISAGAGHRKELQITREDLVRVHGQPGPAASSTEKTPMPIPLADRSTENHIKEGLVGISCLLALAAFVLSLRNHRRLNTIARVVESQRRA